MTDRVLSPSQLEVFKLCPRKWGFVYLQGRREPPQDSAQAGTKIHDILERYLRDGSPIDRDETWKNYAIGEIAHAMTEFLPPAGSVKQTETKLDFEVSGVRYTGRIDGKTDDTVYDHKSTADFKYLKDEEKLQSDLQALIYARWADEDTTLQWTFGRTKGKPKAKPVRLQVIRDEIRTKFEEIVTPLAREVLDSYEKNEPKKLEKNFEACRLYPPKGCPFKDECLTPGERLRTHMSTEKKMTLAEKLAARKKPSNETIVYSQEVIVAQHADGSKDIQLAPATATGKPAQVVHVDPINPPLVTSTGAPAEPLPVVETAGLPKKTRKKKVEDIVVQTPVGELTITADPRVPPGTLVLKEDFTLLTKEENEAIREAATEVPEQRPIRTLYVNAIPLAQNPNLIYAHTLISAAAETVQNDAQVPHIKLIDFGKGGGALAAQLAADIKAMTPGFDLVLMAKNPEGRDVEATLCSLAENVIMGV